MEKMFEKINGFLAELGGYLLIVIMVMVIADVVLRNLGFSIFGVQEMAVFIVVAVIYTGLAYCEEKDGHVRVGLLLDRLSPKANAFLRIWIMVAALGTMGFAGYSLSVSFYRAYVGLDAMMAGNIPLYSWPTRLVMALSMWLYCVQIFFNLLKEIKNFRSDNPSHDPIRDFTI